MYEVLHKLQPDQLFIFWTQCFTVRLLAIYHLPGEASIVLAAAYLTPGYRSNPL